MRSDIEIAQEAELKPIREIAAGVGIDEEELELYGKYKAKLSGECLERLKSKPDGKLILVTAINPTPAGEGKTTVSVGLAQALTRIGKRAVLALREPSLGPCFGVKGGAAGGGYSQVVPMEEINLHFTGDFHAITAANNLLAALIDNHIQQGNALRLDTRQIVWKRCLDMNDRALRNVVIGLGEKSDGFVREDHFIITVASEIMAILCLAEDMADLKEKLSHIIIGYDYDGEPVTAGALGAVGAMAALLKDALRPNLVQTLEHTPVLIHGGPFANIAHGCNSIIATRTARKLGDYCITEAGFGADLGAEKFLDIKCRKAGFTPDAAVLVATVRALKYNGGVEKSALGEENIEALKRGSVNLKRHIANLRRYGLPVAVTANRFPTDTEAELDCLAKLCAAEGVPFTVSEVYARGGAGAEELARIVCELTEKPAVFSPLYDDADDIQSKIEAVATKIYGAAAVEYSAGAKKELARLSALDYDRLPVCIAKTQYSLSDDPKALGAPEGFTFHIRELYVSAGAGFVVALSGSILSMPGLPKNPAAYRIDVNDDGQITGLF